MAVGPLAIPSNVVAKSRQNRKNAVVNKWTPSTKESKVVDKSGHVV